MKLLYFKMKNNIHFFLGVQGHKFCEFHFFTHLKHKFVIYFDFDRRLSFYEPSSILKIYHFWNFDFEFQNLIFIISKFHGILIEIFNGKVAKKVIKMQKLSNILDSPQKITPRYIWRNKKSFKNA